MDNATEKEPGGDTTPGKHVPLAPRKRGPKVDIALNEQRKEDILREAARLFDQVGYHGVNMEMIASAAGLKKPTLYHYIKSKDDILFGIQYRMMEDLRDQTIERIAAGTEPYHLLLGIYEQIFRNLCEKPGAVRSFFEHGRELQPDQMRKVRSARNAFTADVMRIVEQSMKDGIMRSADVRITTMSYFGIVNWAYQWYQPGRDPEPKVIAALCFRTFAEASFIDLPEKTFD